MINQTVLVVEDDEAIRFGILDSLKLSGYEVVQAVDGEEGLEKSLKINCHLVLLDLVMPGPGGLDILKCIRQERPTLPVIIMTALGDEADRIKGLKMGADDYVVKPFSVDELIARVQAVLRRSPEREDPHNIVSLRGVEINFHAKEVKLSNGQIISLSHKEAEILKYFVTHPQRVISRDEMIDRIWRLDPKGISTRTVDMHVARLREKIDKGDDPLISTVRGKGYRFIS